MHPKAEAAFDEQAAAVLARWLLSCIGFFLLVMASCAMAEATRPPRWNGTEARYLQWEQVKEQRRALHQNGVQPVPGQFY